MRKGKLFLLLLLVAIIAAGIYLYPAWKAAKVIEEKSDAGGSSYEIAVSLDKTRMSGEQNKIFETLAELTGLDEASVYSFTIKGQAWEGRNHVLIYPGGGADALVELYMDGSSAVINESLLYGVIHGNMTGKYPLLEHVMPRQDGNLYMTLEQVEQLFDIDLEVVRNLGLGTADNQLNALQCFAALAFLPRQQWGGGYRFSLEKEQVQVCIDVPDEEISSKVAAAIEVQDPAVALAKVKRLLPGLGIRISAGQLQVLKSFSVTWMPGEGGAFDMPVDFVAQGTLDMIAEIRAWVEKLSNGAWGEIGW